MTSEKQKRTRERNFLLLRLRGCEATLSSLVRNPNMTQAARGYAAHCRSLIDGILAEIGAETTKARRIRQRKEEK